MKRVVVFGTTGSGKTWLAKRLSERAKLRVITTVAILAGLALFLMLTIWHEIQRVFGL